MRPTLDKKTARAILLAASLLLVTLSFAALITGVVLRPTAAQEAAKSPLKVELEHVAESDGRDALAVHLLGLSNETHVLVRAFAQAPNGTARELARWRTTANATLELDITHLRGIIEITARSDPAHDPPVSGIAYAFIGNTIFTTAPTFQDLARETSANLTQEVRQ